MAKNTISGPRLTFLGYGACFIAGCLWGTGFYFSRLALNEMSVEYMVLYRILFACLGVLPVALGLILLPFGFRMRRRVRGWACTVWLLIIGVALAAGVTACGGGGSGSGVGGSSTPPQNYVLTVTATAGSLSNTFALGLAVE